MSLDKKDKNLLKRVNSLVRENKNLRKKLSKFRKAASVSVLSKPDLEHSSEKEEEIIECSYCRGEIKRVSLV